MSTASASPEGTGTVLVGSLEITVTPMSKVEERSLRRQLLAGAERDATDYFTRCSRLLDAMRGQPAAHTEAVREIVRLTALGPKVPEEQLLEYRASPAGVAQELFLRGKKATPGLTLDGLAAVVTGANVEEVAGQMWDIVSGEGGGPAAPAPR
ncbi:unnamed protein product [Gemmataceae bacterium]|nr:unnamed protein product [Gemmataceae bacterium]VTT99005.1 unnamed protein product [Gemmataceae bacterium]